MDEPAPESSPAAALSPAEQARIRRERRQAKVREGGTSRLSRITGTQGSTFRSEAEKETESSAPRTTAAAATAPASEPLPAASTSPPPPDAASTPDPPDYDISEHHYVPGGQRRANPSAEELRQMLLMESMLGGGGGRDGFSPSPSPGPGPFGPAGLGGSEDPMVDPMMALLQQMTGAGGAGAGGVGGNPNLEEMMRNMGGMGGMGGMGQETVVEPDPWAPWWRALHAVCALVMTVYCIRWGGFDGTELGRVESENLTRADKPQLFWYFASMELLLQSTRFLLEKGRPPQGSMLTAIGDFLPAPVGPALKTLSRYSAIWSTILADAGVVVFALGMAYWWNSL